MLLEPSISAREGVEERGANELTIAPVSWKVGEAADVPAPFLRSRVPVVLHSRVNPVGENGVCGGVSSFSVVSTSTRTFYHKKPYCSLLQGSW